VSGPGLLEEIRAEAERIRADGTLPAGFEEKLRDDFARLCADPAGLEARAQRRTAPGTAENVPATPISRLRRRLRRLVGPPLRRLQRRGLERAGQLSSRVTARRLAFSERSRAFQQRPGAVGAVIRAVVGSSGQRGELAFPPALLVTGGELADSVIDNFLLAQLTERPAGPTLVIELPGATLQRRLSGVVEPSQLASATSVFGPLLAAKKRSLAAVVVEAAAGDLGGVRAEAFVRLAASRLLPSGRLVVLSETPGWRRSFDPLAADFSSFQPASAQTWCFLFASNGLADAKSTQSTDGSAYAAAGQAAT
jgi:hypothetical protein